MAKFLEKYKARKLRKRGDSIKSIASILNVSSSSVSTWVRDIKLTPKQYLILENNSRDPYYGKRLNHINDVKHKTEMKIIKLFGQGINDVGILTKRELFLVGIGLYWSEGFKKDSQVGFANSDPKMINFFMKWLFECFNYKVEDLIPRVTVNISHKHRINEIEKYWSNETKIPINLFKKPFYQNFIWKKVYENPNEYFGLLRVKVRKSKDFLRRIHGFIQGLRLQVE
jgi:hypothetical protein